jgi:hypothetical protein
VHYEVREGNGDFVSADRYYVLKDQSLKTPVTVRAVDENGTSAEVTLNGGLPVIPIVVVVIVLAVALWLYYARRKKSA